MKNITPYLPFAIIAVAAILGIYFFYYKPKKDATDAANALSQQDYDAQLTAYNSGTKLSNSISTQGSVLVTRALNVNPALLAKLLKAK